MNWRKIKFRVLAIVLVLPLFLAFLSLLGFGLNLSSNFLIPPSLLRLEMEIGIALVGFFGYVVYLLWVWPDRYPKARYSVDRSESDK